MAKKDKNKNKEEYVITFLQEGDVNPLTREECFEILRRQLFEKNVPLSQQVRVFKVAEEVDVDAKLVPMLDGEEE